MASVARPGIPIESTTLNSVARVVADTLRDGYGIAPEPIFASAGLDYAALHFPRGRYGFAGMQRLWQAAAAASGDPCFGLRAGERIRPTTASVLGVAWMASGTLREALGRLCRYIRVISTAPLALTVEDDGETGCLRFEYPATALLAPVVSVDALLAAVLTMARMVARPGLRPSAVWLRHDHDGYAGEYERFFACAVRFRADRDAMAFDGALLDAPLVGHESKVAQAADVAAERYVRAMEPRSVTAEVQQALAKLLPSGPVSLDELARRLNRGVSTLQRQLQEEGVSFRQILEQTRRSRAEEYLAEPGLSLGEIAYLLGFSDQSAFSRAFSRAAGVSPRRFREQLGQPKPVPELR